MLVAKFTLICMSFMYPLQKCFLGKNLDVCVCQQEEKIVGFRRAVGVPDGTGERTLPAKTAQLINDFRDMAGSFERPIFLQRLWHHRLSGATIKTLVLFLDRLSKGGGGVPFLLTLQFRQHLGRLNYPPTLRVALKCLLAREHLTDSLVKLLPLYLLACIVSLRQALQHETREQRMRLIAGKACVPAQASKTLEKAARACGFKDQIIDMEIDAYIDGRGANQNIFVVGLLSFLTRGQAGILAHLNAVGLEIAPQEIHQPPRCRNRVN